MSISLTDYSSVCNQPAQGNDLRHHISLAPFEYEYDFRYLFALIAIRIMLSFLYILTQARSHFHFFSLSSPISSIPRLKLISIYIQIWDELASWLLFVPISWLVYKLCFFSAQRWTQQREKQQQIDTETRSCSRVGRMWNDDNIRQSQSSYSQVIYFMIEGLYFLFSTFGTFILYFF